MSSIETGSSLPPASQDVAQQAEPPISKERIHQAFAQRHLYIGHKVGENLSLLESREGKASFGQIRLLYQAAMDAKQINIDTRTTTHHAFKAMTDRLETKLSSLWNRFLTAIGFNKDAHYQLIQARILLDTHSQALNIEPMITSLKPIFGDVSHAEMDSKDNFLANNQTFKNATKGTAFLLTIPEKKYTETDDDEEVERIIPEQTFLIVKTGQDYAFCHPVTINDCATQGAELKGLSSNLALQNLKAGDTAVVEISGEKRTFYRGGNAEQDQHIGAHSRTSSNIISELSLNPTMPTSPFRPPTPTHYGNT